MVTIDGELKDILGVLKDTQKKLALPILLFLGIALQTKIEMLEPLRPIGIYAAVHCVGIFALTLWQDVPELSIALERIKYQEHAHLLLSSIGCAIMSTCSSEQSAEACRLALIFLLPAVLVWQVQEMKQIGTREIGAYLALQYAMVCTHLREGFWERGWQLCLFAMVFDAVILRLASGTSHVKQDAEVTTHGVLRGILGALSDGSCIIGENGAILLSDPSMTSLVGAGTDEGWELEGLPFSSLVAPGADREARPQAGVSTTTLRSGESTVGVEMYTMKCPFSLDFARSLLDPQRKAAVGKQPADVMEGAFLRLVRKRDAAAPRSPARGQSPQRRQRSDVGFHSELGWQASEVSAHSIDVSDLGSGINKKVVSLANVRLNTLSERSLHWQPPSADDGGMPFTVELDLPQSEVGSLVSEQRNSGGNNETPSSSAAMARVRIKSKPRPSSIVSGGGRPTSTSIVSAGGGGGGGSEVGSMCSGFSHTRRRSERTLTMSSMSAKSATKSVVSSCAPSEDGNGSDGEKNSEDSVEELVSSEVKSIGPAKDGRVRVQVGFKSRFLQQQASLLDSVSSELECAKRDVHIMSKTQQDSKEVLRRFQKIVTREFAPAGDSSPLNVTVFIFEERPEVRASLQKLCQTQSFSCEAFASVQDGFKAVQDWHEQQQGRGKSGTRERLPPLPPQAAGSTPEKGAAPPLQLVLVSSQLLAQLPTEWSLAGIFVALVGRSDELQEVGRALMACNEAEVRERLRSIGVNDCLPYPLPPDRLTSLAQTVLHRRYLDDYLLVEQLGRGATATVYSAKRLRDGEAVALKEINLSKMLRRRCGQEDVDKVWAEAELLRSFHWPTVMSLSDAWQGKDGKLLYMAMPCLEGGTLQQQVDQAQKAGKRLHSEQAAGWYAQALHALCYLHWRGILHRDVKLDNMLLATGNMSLRLSDFGTAARLPGAGPHPAREGCVPGSVTTAHINAPEVLLKSTHYASSDLWSLAASFFEVFTLRSMLPATTDTLELEPLVKKINVEARAPASAVISGLASIAGCQSGSDAGAGPPPPLPSEVDSPHDAGAGPKPGAEVSIHKLLQRAPSEILVELAELLCQDPLARPSAAALASRPHSRARLGQVLAEAGALPGSICLDDHLEDFERLVTESSG